MNIQETPFQKALDAVESLPVDAQEEVIAIIKKRLVEDRREEIAANAHEAVTAVREGRAIYGTTEDLKKDLKKIMKEAMVSVLTERKDILEDAVSEAILDIMLGSAIEEGDTGEYVPEDEILSKLAD
jgi:hypothetical protein